MSEPKTCPSYGRRAGGLLLAVVLGQIDVMLAARLPFGLAVLALAAILPGWMLGARLALTCCHGQHEEAE